MQLSEEYEKMLKTDFLERIRLSIAQIQDIELKESQKYADNSIDSILYRFNKLNMCHRIFSSDHLVKAALKAQIKKKALVFPLKKNWILIFQKNNIIVNSAYSLLLFHRFNLRIYVSEYLNFFMKLFNRVKVDSSGNYGFVIGSKTSNYGESTLNNFGNWISKELGNLEYENLYVVIEDDTSWLQNERFRCISDFESIYIDGKNGLRNYLIYGFKRILRFNINPLTLKYPRYVAGILNIKKNKIEWPKFIVTTSGMSPVQTPIIEYLGRVGSRIIFVNLSLAIDPVKESFQTNTQWSKFSNWSEVWCVNDNQQLIFSNQDFFKISKYVTVGVPDWIDISEKINLPMKNNWSGILSIFDYEPISNYYGYSTLNDLYLSDLDACTKFLNSVIKVANELNVFVIHKPKRSSGANRKKGYQELTSSLTKNFKNYTILDSNFAPRKLIIESSAVVSIPFTTTAILGSELGKPSCFYDPTGYVNKQDPAASGMQIFNDSGEFKKWLERQI
jgi:polysaccharide biosynthesis PFTS motif protein